MEFKKKEDVENDAELTYQARKQLPASAFVYPKERKYPIHDLSHARNALARVAAYGTPEEKSRVQAAVYNKFPELKKRKEERGDSTPIGNTFAFQGSDAVKGLEGVKEGMTAKELAMSEARAQFMLINEIHGKYDAKMSETDKKKYDAAQKCLADYFKMTK